MLIRLLYTRDAAYFHAAIAAGGFIAATAAADYAAICLLIP